MKRNPAAVINPGDRFGYLTVVADCGERKNDISYGNVVAIAAGRHASVELQMRNAAGRRRHHINGDQDMKTFEPGVAYFMG